jgi:hypothetical protein
MPSVCHETPRERRVGGADRTEARDDVGATIEMRAQPMPHAHPFHHPVDQQLHGMDAVALHFAAETRWSAPGSPSRKWFMPPTRATGSQEAGGDAAAEQRRNDDARLGSTIAFSPWTMETPAHQVSSPNTRSIFSFSAAGAKVSRHSC